MKAIGIDLGTTGISGILFSVEEKNIIKSITKESDAFIKTENTWEKIQDVDKIIGMAQDILDELICEDVLVIGVTGQMHGIVYFDKKGDSVSPLYIWQDGRGNLPYKDTTYAKHLSSFSGYGCVTDFYNKTNCLVPENAVGFCTIADYFVMKLCANVKPVIHATNLASFGCYDIETKIFSCDYQPLVTDEFKVVGKYKNIPVSVAFGDNQASVLASCKKQDILLNVGTGSQVSIITDKIYFADNIETRPYFENNFLTVGSALCGGRAYSLMKDFIREIISQKVSVSDKEVYQIMENLLSIIDKPTVKADTRFAGTRADKNITGSFTFVSSENFKPGEFIYSVLYGMAEELYGMYNSFGVKRKSIVGSGNGIKKNKRLMKIIEELYGVSLKIPNFEEEASFGAMLFGLIAIGKYQSVEEAQTLIKYKN